MAPGLIALCAALICAVAAGVLLRHRNGRMRSVRGGPAAVSPGAAAGADQAGGATTALSGARLVTSADLGQPLGERATLVQFSSAFCAPCRATRRILADVAGMVEGVAHVEIDAETRLDLVRRLGVLKTPTVLVTDSAGRIVKRASGQPRKPDVLAALGTAVGGDPISINPIGKDASDISVRPA
jgi:thiol-disulfide isomerase/thioredoxin